MKNLLLLLTGLGLLVGLFLWMKPPPATTSEAPAAGESPVAAAIVPAAAVTAVPAPQQVELQIQGQRLIAGPAVISVAQGTALTLRITTDEADELHLHGYDLTLALPANQTAELRFTADRSGRFEYELHESHRTLGALEVQPR